jgi:phosphomannomutase
MQSESSGITTNDLRSHLAYEPRDLKFGTSGRRGLVADLTQLEVYINALAELEYLQSLPLVEGGIEKGDEVFFAYDLRPSSITYVPEEKGRGEIAQAIEQAIRDVGMKPLNMGAIPTPALACYALSQQRGSIMITGSHIPFDRNGYKTNTSMGELLKKHEQPIQKFVEHVRSRVYDELFEKSLFDENGRFKKGHAELSPENSTAKDFYISRYTQFFQGESLNGMRVLVYQHSSVGRDLVVDILRKFGAEVIPVGRSDSFVPIDTENIDASQLATLQVLTSKATAKVGMVHALLSVDGDSDRPLILAVDFATSKLRFFSGDLLGIVVAEYLGADAVVVPISCNDAIDRSDLSEVLEPKTKIGSPFVIEGMNAAMERGKRKVCGWEANGGFLIGSEILRNGKTLDALPTRDAVLPLLCALFSAHEKELSLGELFARLPRRSSRAALLKQFPREVAIRLVNRFSLEEPQINEVIFRGSSVELLDANKQPLDMSDDRETNAISIRAKLAVYFNASNGFDEIIRLNYTDGVRITFRNNDVAHLRPSGNADELRIYVVADNEKRAEEMAALAIAEPQGILRSMEKAVLESSRS